MSQTPDVPRLISARRTESVDAPNILCLVNKTSEVLFGRTNVVNLIERALLAITLTNEADEILAHAAFLDYPNISCVDQADWPEWLTSYFDLAKCNSLNTVFMHYFVSKSDYAHGCARELVRAMFNAIPDIHYCILTVPVGVTPDDSLSELFSPVKCLSETSPDNVELYVCFRHEHVPVLYIRDARVEDHDDLVPIFNRHTELLAQNYGEYHLAELIESQDDDMKCIVAEADGFAVGFMSVSKDLNLPLLNKCFELGPFHGLCVPHPDDVTEPPIHVKASVDDDNELIDSAIEKPASVNDETEYVEKSKSETESRASRRNSEKSLSVSGSERVSPVAEPNGENVFVYADDKTDLTVKRKLGDGQSSGSCFSDNTTDDAAYASAVNRALSAGQTSQESKGKMFPKPPSLETGKSRFIPEYHGASNAFCIQMFCIDERYETRSCDFLLKAFELFPDREFCIISVPHLVPEFPLLQQFVHVTPRVPSTLSQELYVFGAAGLQSHFNVRPCVSADVSGVEKLAKSLSLGSVLVTDLRQYLKAHRDDDGTELQVFVAEVSRQIVGVAILRREEDIEYIRSHYNIEDFIYFSHHRREEHGHLYHYALNPVFKHFSKLFLKEILRLGHKTSLYYPVYPAYADKQLLMKHSLVAALSDMVAVRARRQIVYPVDMLGVNGPSERILQAKEQFALNHVNCKLVLEPKVTLNVRVVVVGASDVGISLLETLTFCPHLRFNNLTLISPHGLPGELPPNRQRDNFLSTSHCFNQDDYDQMSLRTWVNVVCGKLTAINRRKKHVVVNGNFVVPYDHLVLCTGTQYQIPNPTGLDTDNGATNSDLDDVERPQPRLRGTSPKNAFVINDAYEAAVALYWIDNNLLSSSENTGQVVIYGSSIDVYCCVETLLEIGVRGKNIIIVEPPQPSKVKVTCFNNPEVEATVAEALRAAGVQVHSGYILAQWDVSDDDCDDEGLCEISSASFTSDTVPLKLNCAAFISYYAKMVDYDTFSAINHACLVYDGRLVIDASFHTNDPSIRAAGPLTKYQRGYYTELTHADFNSREIGVQLAGALLSLFDPTMETVKDDDADVKLVPVYRTAKVVGGVLPGGYNYLHVEKAASPRIPLAELVAGLDYGREMVTGQCGGSPEYFRLHINQFNVIQTVTCLSKSPLVTSNLLMLYGVHQRFLNNLVGRFNEGLIEDFYGYFQEPWAMAIYHDRFNDFRDEVRELLISRPSPDEESLDETIRILMENDTSLTDGQKGMLKARYLNSGTKRAIETHLLNFLSYNYYHLPMYAKPGMV